MISAQLANLGNSLRRAAGRGEYVEIERLAAEVGGAATAEVRSLPAGDPRVREVADWLRDILDSAATLVRIGRAARADELRRIPFLKTYLRQTSLSNL